MKRCPKCESSAIRKEWKIKGYIYKCINCGWESPETLTLMDLKIWGTGEE